MPTERAAPSRSARQRVQIEAVAPQVDGGRYSVKRVLGDVVTVTCDLVCDGSDRVAAALLHRGPSGRETEPWEGTPFVAGANDRFAASFPVGKVGRWEFAILAWVDDFATWSLRTHKKLEAGQDVEVELTAGALLLRAHAARAAGADAAALREAATQLENAATMQGVRFSTATRASTVEIAARYPDLADATRTEPSSVVVDPPRARFSSWYEMFPRSAGTSGAHGTFRDCANRLPYVAEMGFDILYLPPIHPIGRTFRKGPNNALDAGPNDVGSPWAIGSAEGGHKAVHPSLGTLEEFRALVREARTLGVEIAIDIALQTSPDHPYVKEHPEWFKRRPYGEIQYAENPPKKYQDVYPFDFECEAWESLWRELASIFFFWCEQGVRVFRVDNPHTKPLRFWEWCISEIKAQYPEVILLAEAFARPKLMYALAKAGFTQSYTYFAWRHSRWEFTTYVQELTRAPIAEFYRPNFWPNTPDILTEYLQFGNRPAFVQRLVLAAMLSSNYGIYGPPFELMEHVARPGTEEYVDNEKYQLRAWEIERDDSLRDVIALVNRIRRANPALQDNLVTFHPTDNDQLLAFSKRSRDGTNVVLVVVNLDAHHSHATTVDLDLEALGIPRNEAFQVHDVLADAQYRWEGNHAHVAIDPNVLPASVFVIRHRAKTEEDFDYFV